MNWQGTGAVFDSHNMHLLVRMHIFFGPIDMMGTKSEELI